MKMKNKVNVQSNLGCKKKAKPKELVTSKHFITKRKKTSFTLSNHKLFSLQHQTLNLLRKADKYKVKRKSELVNNDLNNLMNRAVIKDENSCSFDLSKVTSSEIKKNASKTISDSISHDFKEKETVCNSSNQSHNRPTCSKNIYDNSNSNNGSTMKQSDKLSNRKRKKIKAIDPIKKHDKINFLSDDLPSVKECAIDAIKNIESENETINCNDFNADDIKFPKKSTSNSKKISKKKIKREKLLKTCEKELKMDVNPYNISSEDDGESSFVGCKEMSDKSFEKTLEYEESPVNNNVVERKSCGSSPDYLNIEETLLSLNNSNADFYKLGNSNVLLTLLHPCSLYFIGVLEIEVLFGTVDILGCALNKCSGKNTVYSPRGLSHLCIKTKQCERFNDNTNRILSNHSVPKEKINILKENFNGNIVIVLLKKDTSYMSSLIWPNFVEIYSGVTLLPKVNTNESFNAIEDALKCKFQLHSESNTKLYNEKSDWNKIYDVVGTGVHRTVLCGGKGVGKSTLLRFLVNRSLSEWGKVLVVDFDPGQSEFMAPGCVSAFVVTSPLLGPNFTHLLDPVRSMFFGSTDVVQAMKSYFVCVQNVIDYCNSQDEFKNIPWFFNMMGFNKGIGVPITSSVIKNISPSLLIQIRSVNKSRNYPSILTPDFVEKNVLNLTSCTSNYKTLDYRVLLTETAVENTRKPKNNRHQPDIWGLSPSSLRNIMILSYFGQMLDTRFRDIFQIEPYNISISDIHLEVLNEDLSKEDALDTINGNLVALCDKNVQANEINSCLGYGIVRAVNKETGQLFLLTPLKKDKLSQVNSLIKGSLSLPERLFTSPPESVRGHVPYISITRNLLSHKVKKIYKYNKTNLL